MKASGSNAAHPFRPALSSLFTVLSVGQKAEFSAIRFIKNNSRTLLISFFLFAEQLFYGCFRSAPESPEQRVSFFCAAAMLVFTAVCLHFIKSPPAKTNIFHRIFSISLAFFCMAIALHRLSLTTFNEFHLPTLFFALNYGIAVVFYLSGREGALLYPLFMAAALVTVRHFHPQISGPAFAIDIVSNGIIAWIISFVNYRALLRNFLLQNLISEKDSELFHANEQLRYTNRRLLEISEKDALTGLLNRRKLDEILHHETEIIKRHGGGFSVILIDLDHFKNVNDSFGHGAGDEALVKIAAILKANLREIDECARWGGEEFLILCKHTALEKAALLAQRIRLLIESATFDKAGKLTASFGVASYDESGDLGTLLRKADARLYNAKKNGRNRVENEGGDFSRILSSLGE